MTTQVDCPICMDCIESTTKNCVTTECGHCFHTNCLMKSVAHNGFGCPYCRTAMAEEPKEEETVWSDEEEEDEEEEDEEEEMFDDDALRGFRFFWDNLNSEPHDEDDEADEFQFEEWAERDVANQNEADPSIPTTDFVAQKLREQGVTFEQLVKMVCFNEHEEYEYDEAGERLTGDIFGKVRIILSNYTPEQAAVPVQEPAPVVHPAPEVDFAAQPKTQVRSVPTFMIHV